MKELKPITIKRFKCDFCTKTYRTTAQACIDHERICYRNPNRTCDTCQEEGIELYPILGDNLGVIPDGGERTCPSCLIAEQAGGKSFIKSVKTI